MTIRIRCVLFGLLLAAMSAAPATVATAAARTLRVAYAGSMGVVMDRSLGPAFAARDHVTYQGIGRGSYALAHLIAGRQLRADVFVAITQGPFAILRKARLIRAAVPIASTAIVIAYGPKSRFGRQFASGTPWWKVLESRGLRFGRTDPTTDPLGRNTIFTMLLAERYYHQPDLAAKILGPLVNPRQIFTETSILSRLEAGELDATAGYRSAVISHHLPFVTLPEEINLSNPAMQAGWYSKVHFSLPGAGAAKKTLGTEPLVYYAVALEDAPHPELARKFVRFLLSPAGQKILTADGYGKPRGGPLR